MSVSRESVQRVLLGIKNSAHVINQNVENLSSASPSTSGTQSPANVSALSEKFVKEAVSGTRRLALATTTDVFLNFVSLLKSGMLNLTSVLVPTLPGVLRATLGAKRHAIAFLF